MIEYTADTGYYGVPARTVEHGPDGRTVLLPAEHWMKLGAAHLRALDLSEDETNEWNLFLTLEMGYRRWKRAGEPLDEPRFLESS